jgi:hypothetical protein
MITETFQVILKYVAPGQEDIVIQNVCKKLSFAFNDSEKKLETMTEALNEAYQFSVGKCLENVFIVELYISFWTHIVFLSVRVFGFSDKIPL